MHNFVPCWEVRLFPNQMCLEIDSTIEIEARAISSQREMSVVRQQVQQSQRQSRLLDLTRAELGTLPEGTHLYEGVGKMFLRADAAAVRDRMEVERKGMAGDVVALEKKLQYLSTTFENAKMHIQAAMGAGPNAAQT